MCPSGGGRISSRSQADSAAPASPVLGDVTGESSREPALNGSAQTSVGLSPAHDGAGSSTSTPVPPPPSAEQSSLAQADPSQGG